MTPNDSPDGNDIIECWCGATGTYDELFDSSLDETCGGTGSLNCHCGGDFCVCHHHGETECEGCEDCESGGSDEDDYSDCYDAMEEDN